ncbi:MAG: DUF3325 family protein [Pseudomonadota bacterium]
MATLLTLLATAALCFTMPRHQVLVFSRPLSRALQLGARCGAFAVLGLACTWFVAEQGALIGMTTFLGWFTVCMILVALTVTRLSRRS